MNHASILALSALTCTSLACAAGPNFRRPPAAVPSEWTAAATRGTSPAVQPETDLWWTSFQDLELDALMLRAAEANYDVKRAIARVEEARAARGVTRSGHSPQIDARASADRSRQVAVGGLLSPLTTGQPAIQPSPLESSQYLGGFDASWELDLFGRIRREVEAASGDLIGSEQDRRNVLISIFGEVGRFYSDLRGLQLRVRIAEQNIAADDETVTLTRALAQAGQATERDVAQAEAQWESVRAQVPGLTSGIALSIHRLSVLTGQQPGALDAELANPAPVLVVPPHVPVGLPADLLERRPDVARAEAELAAATARVGQAKADYFPRVTLLGTAGRQASQIHELTLGFANFFSVGPSITVPVFNGGRIRSNVAIQNARVKQALNVYQSTVLAALEETENALVNYANEQDRRDRLVATVRATQTALELANVQYRAGLTDFLSVLDSERLLYTNQDFLAQSETAISTDLVALYKALGGGWSLSPQAPWNP